MKTKKYIIFILLIPVIILVYIMLANREHEGEPGTKTNPIKIYFTPSINSNEISESAKNLIDFLEQETGYHFIYTVPENFNNVIDAFGKQKADMAFINTYSYLKAHDKYGVEAKLRLIREGNETTYTGEIITHTDSKINSIEELSGKSFAFVDSSSTSGYILPKNMLDKKGIKLKKVIFAQNHDEVVSLVYNKKVDAGATYYAPPDPNTGQIKDARMRLLNVYPDVEKKIKIIGFTRDIPNDPLVFRKNLDPKIVNEIIKALSLYTSSESGRKSFLKLSGAVGLIQTEDNDYNVLREMLKEQGNKF